MFKVIHALSNSVCFIEFLHFLIGFPLVNEYMLRDIASVLIELYILYTLILDSRQAQAHEVNAMLNKPSDF